VLCQSQWNYNIGDLKEQLVRRVLAKCNGASSQNLSGRDYKEEMYNANTDTAVGTSS